VVFDGRVSSRGAATTGASGEGVGTALWPGTGTDKPLEIVKGAIKESKTSASDVVAGGHRGELAH